MYEVLFPLGVSQYLIGGLLVGLGIAIPYVLTGLVTGVSTVFTSTWSYLIPAPYFQSTYLRSVRVERIALALGLICGGVLYVYFIHGAPLAATTIPWYRLLLGGFFVGLGARMSGGCTSGHAICGIASLEKVSLLATVTFLLTGIIVATVTALVWPL